MTGLNIGAVFKAFSSLSVSFGGGVLLSRSRTLHVATFLRFPSSSVFTQSQATMSYTVIEKGSLNTLSYLLYFGIICFIS